MTPREWRTFALIVVPALAFVLALLWWGLQPAEGAADEGQVYRVSAYCLRGTTASGAPAGPGSIAAPSSLPFGSRLYVDGYGDGTVVDRGGAIYGNRLDIWLECPAAWHWGVRYVRVTVLEPMG